MNLTTIDTKGLKALLGLIEKRESLQAQIAQIEGQISRMAGGAAPAAVAPAKRSAGKSAASAKKVSPAKKAAPAKRKGRKRGRTGAKIMAFLKNAGSKGATVKELSEALKIKSQNLYVWFNSTGKKNPQIKKTGPAKYVLKA